METGPVRRECVKGPTEIRNHKFTCSGIKTDSFPKIPQQWGGNMNWVNPSLRSAKVRVQKWSGKESKKEPREGHETGSRWLGKTGRDKGTERVGVGRLEPLLVLTQVLWVLGNGSHGRWQ
jgi:hypothetical protein